MKTCRLCLTTEPNQFYETQNHKLCRACFRATYYQPGKDRLLQSKLDRGQCGDCELKVTLANAVVFDYDHRDASTKTTEVSRLCYAPLQAFQDEQAKCDLVCANCHRLRTQARGYFKGGGRPRKPVLPPQPVDLETHIRF
jgi:hypothetical protein